MIIYPVIRLAVNPLVSRNSNPRSWMYSKLMIILTKNENVLSSKTINGSEMGNERGKGSIPLILFIKLRYSEFRILMPMVHVIPD